MPIRPATPEDVLPVARVHVESWRATYRGLMPDDVLDNLDVERRAQRWLEILQASDRQLFVLDAGSGLIGFYHIAPSRDKDTDSTEIGEITAIYLVPSLQRRGHGRALCTHALEELSRQGFSQSILWVLKDNAGARRFYEALGFHLNGGEKTLASLKVKGVRYRKDLDEYNRKMD